MRNYTAAALLAASLLLLTGCNFESLGDSQRFHEDFHYSYTVKPGARLSLENFNGAVEITASSDDRVDVSGTKYAATENLLKSLRVDINASPDSVRVTTIRPSGYDFGGFSVRYTLRVPRQMRLDRVQTTNGSLEADGLELPATLRTTNGAITIRDFGANVDAQTTNGSVRATGVKGSLTARTTNGAIRAEDVAGGFDGSTTNGSISARVAGKAEGRGVRAETTNGSVDLTVEQVGSEGVRVRTSNSAITLRLPGNVNARVNADTTHGRIDDEFDLPSNSTRGNRRTSVDGVIGSGGAPVELRTTNGAIHLRKI